MTAFSALCTSRTRRRTQRMAPGSSTVLRRTALAAAARLLARSAAATTASSAFSVPGSRAARQFGSRLKVVWLCGQYQRATRAPCGVLRSYVPWRASAQPPRGWFGHRSSLASRHTRAITYCSPVSPVLKRSYTGLGPGGGWRRAGLPLLLLGAEITGTKPSGEAQGAFSGPAGQRVGKLACPPVVRIDPASPEIW